MVVVLIKATKCGGNLLSQISLTETSPYFYRQDHANPVHWLLTDSFIQQILTEHTVHESLWAWDSGPALEELTFHRKSDKPTGIVTLC